MSATNPYAAPKKVAPVVEETAPAEDTVPEGTIKTVLAWVDGDVDKATLAYEYEESSESPRTSLLTQLEDIING